MEEDDRARPLKLDASELRKWLVIRRCPTDESPGLQASPVPKRPLPDSGTDAADLDVPTQDDFSET
jgi:hypothetical protein